MIAKNLILIGKPYKYDQWRLVAFINGAASKTIIEMSKSFIHRLPEFLVVFRLTVILPYM